MPGAPPARVDVNLRLTPDTCDVEAGDFLDLQGVGVYRENRRLSPKRAIRACADAVRRDPSNARFHFQLGKALEADGQLQAALNAYEQAVKLGHIRAEHALGALALGQPGQEPVAMIYFRRCADKGDPYCMQSLGAMLLNIARTPDEREEAYDLLSFAVDLGLPDAMRTLANHFDNPATPDHDPERAAIFNREADLRDGGGRTVRPGTGGFLDDDPDWRGPQGEAPSDSSGDPPSPSDPQGRF